MRLGLSVLNSQRYMYDIIPSPAREKCAAPNKDSYHLLFVCPAYAVPRQALTLSLNLILPADTLDNKKQVEQILLYGSDNLDHLTNHLLFDILHVFIYSCGRF